MSTVTNVRQLSNGLLISGDRPPRDPPLPSRDLHRLPSLPSPYTGGDHRRSGEIAKMLHVSTPTADPTSASNATSSSRPHSRSYSGPLSLIPPTGLITGGSEADPKPDPKTPKRTKKEYDAAVSDVSGERGFGFAVSRVAIWAGIAAAAVGSGVGVLVAVVVGKFFVLAAMGAALVAAAVVGVWNWGRGRRVLETFLRGRKDTEIDPRNLPVGRIVKVTGLVTCGAAPLETSYQNIPRCVYVSTELYEYRGWNGLPVDSKHKPFTWGLRYSERRVSDFYISDPNSGTRFLVRAGNGARVASFVKSATIVDMTKKNRELTPTFLSWLTEHNLSSDSRILRLEEGYIKEGGTASVMGILRKHENLTIIDQPRDIISTGCQLMRCFFPMYIEGLVLIGDTTPEGEVCHV